MGTVAVMSLPARMFVSTATNSNFMESEKHTVDISLHADDVQARDERYVRAVFDGVGSIEGDLRTGGGRRAGVAVLRVPVVVPAVVAVALVVVAAVAGVALDVVARLAAHGLFAGARLGVRGEGWEWRERQCHVARRARDDEHGCQSEDGCRVERL